jgi:hypothetical protein
MFILGAIVKAERTLILAPITADWAAATMKAT